MGPGAGPLWNCQADLSPSFCYRLSQMPEGIVNYFVVILLLAFFFIFEFLFKISTLLDSSLGPFSHYVGYFFGPLLAKF